MGLNYRFKPDEIPDFTSKDSPVIERSKRVIKIASEGGGDTTDKRVAVRNVTLDLTFEPDNGAVKNFTVPLEAFWLYVIEDCAWVTEDFIEAPSQAFPGEDEPVPGYFRRYMECVSSVGPVYPYDADTVNRAENIQIDVGSSSSGTLTINSLSFEESTPGPNPDYFDYPLYTTITVVGEPFTKNKRELMFYENNGGGMQLGKHTFYCGESVHCPSNSVNGRTINLWRD